MQEKEYALYKGEDIIAMGTKSEIAKQLLAMEHHHTQKEQVKKMEEG